MRVLPPNFWWERQSVSHLFYFIIHRSSNYPVYDAFYAETFQKYLASNICQPCTFSFIRFLVICSNKHIRALHEKSKPFKCSECKSQFSFQDGLTRHVAMVHREARPFKCPESECNKTFKQKAHAEKHFASVHQKLKPCVCFCGAAFRENYNMKQHQRAVHNMNPQWRRENDFDLADKLFFQNWNWWTIQLHYSNFVRNILSKHEYWNNKGLHLNFYRKQ